MINSSGDTHNDNFSKSTNTLPDKLVNENIAR